MYPGICGRGWRPARLRLKRHSIGTGVMPEHRVAVGGREMRIFLCAIAAVFSLGGCGKKAPPTPPAVDVAVLTVVPAPATVTEDYVAQTEAVNTVEIRP